jgi:hypothetical protein
VGALSTAVPPCTTRIASPNRETVGPRISVGAATLVYHSERSENWTEDR